MDSVTNSNVRSTGGRYEIKLGVTFSDKDDSEYNHAVMWGFEPSLTVDSQNPRLDLNYIIHKKYWSELDVEPTKFTEDDGSELVHSHGYFDSPYNPEHIPETVKNKLEELFSEELVDGTFNNPPENADSVEVPTISEEHSVEVFEMTIQVDGSYTEELEEDDPRVGNGHFTSEVKDAETGEVLHTSYRISHGMSWWFTPTPDGPEIEKCFHKSWDDKMKGNFEENYPGETVVEAYQEEETTPSMDSVPDDILHTLTGWFGENLIRSSLTGNQIPRVVYECFDCREASKVTPRDHCPKCGSESLCEFESLLHYRKHIRDRDEDEEELMNWLASAEVSVEEGDI